MVKYGDYKTTYTIKVESINGNAKFKGTNLNIYVENNFILEYGKMINVYGTFNKPPQATNYKAFDYSEYLKTKGIFGLVNVEGKIQVSNKTFLNPIFIFSNNLKNKIESNLDKILGEYSEITKRNITSEILME